MACAPRASKLTRAALRVAAVDESIERNRDIRDSPDGSGSSKLFMVWSDVYFPRDRYRVAFFTEDKQSFVDQNPQQPAAESAFAYKPSRTTRGRNKAVFYSILGAFFGAEHARCYEVEQAAAATEPISE
jgi:hypothetical protein